MQKNEIKNTSNVECYRDIRRVHKTKKRYYWMKTKPESRLREGAKREYKPLDMENINDNNKNQNTSDVECHRSNKEDKLNEATAKLILKLTQQNDEEFEQSVIDMMRQIQVLPEKERMICNNYYLNMFDIVRELRKNGFTA